MKISPPSFVFFIVKIFMSIAWIEIYIYIDRIDRNIDDVKLILMICVDFDWTHQDYFEKIWKREKQKSFTLVYGRFLFIYCFMFLPLDPTIFNEVKDFTSLLHIYKSGTSKVIDFNWFWSKKNKHGWIEIRMNSKCV